MHPNISHFLVILFLIRCVKVLKASISLSDCVWKTTLPQQAAYGHVGATSRNKRQHDCRKNEETRPHPLLRFLRCQWAPAGHMTCPTASHVCSQNRHTHTQKQRGHCGGYFTYFDHPISVLQVSVLTKSHDQMCWREEIIPGRCKTRFLPPCGSTETCQRVNSPPWFPSTSTNTTHTHQLQSPPHGCPAGERGHDLSAL